MQPPGGENLAFSPIFVSLHIIELHIHIAHVNTQQSISQASLAKVVTCRYCLALWNSFNPACRFS